MNRKLFISCITCSFIFFIHQQAVTAQACRDVTPVEQQLYQKLITAWDKAVLSVARRDGWNGQSPNEQVTPTVARGKPMPERPMMLCDEDRFAIDCEPSDGSARKQMGGQLTMQIRTRINTPLFILSSPHSGPIPAVCHKINIPGVALAYELTWKSPGETDHYKIVLGLGKWKDDIKNYDLGSELYVHYHFSHPFPSAVIENMIITISAGSLEEARRLATDIDWATLNAVLE